MIKWQPLYVYMCVYVYMKPLHRHEQFCRVRFCSKTRVKAWLLPVVVVRIITHNQTIISSFIFSDAVPSNCSTQPQSVPESLWTYRITEHIKELDGCWIQLVVYTKDLNPFFYIIFIIFFQNSFSKILIQIHSKWVHRYCKIFTINLVCNWNGL